MAGDHKGDIDNHGIALNQGDGKSVCLSELWPYPRGKDPRLVDVA